MRSCPVQLYEQMIREINESKTQFPVKLEMMEHCFLLSFTYANELAKQPVKDINYYKVWKPKFEGSIDYYSLCYHAALFLEHAIDNVAKESFLLRELQRLQKFKEENKSLCDYYTNGETYKDEIWFTDDSPYPALLVKLIALERYTAYLQVELQSLKQQILR